MGVPLPLWGTRGDGRPGAATAAVRPGGKSVAAVRRFGSAIAAAPAELLGQATGRHGGDGHNPLAMVSLALALACLGLLEISQLLPVLLGALVYATVTQRGGRASMRRAAPTPAPCRGWSPSEARRPCWRGACAKVPPPPEPSAPPDLRQCSKMPVRPPSFRAATLDAQVRELVAQLRPSPESDRIARELAKRAQAAIQAVLPEIEVAGFAGGDVARGTAFGVAVPELDLVATASPQMMLRQLQGRLTKGGLSVARLDARKLQKSAIRMCTDQLVSQGGFKFRRSAFRGEEPKVTLMAPPALGVADRGIPMDFSVNSPTPAFNASLLRAASEIDARAQDLVLVVRRWAKDRGICHAAKGHLPPYGWTLLTLYFMQVGAEVAPLLPPLQGFRLVTGPAIRPGGGATGAQRRWEPPEEGSEAALLAVGELFRRFVHFYRRGVDWRREAVSVRLGRRAAPSLHLMLHIIAHEDGRSESGPGIEDPFDPGRNVGASLTALGVARLHEEFARADALLSRGASLSELLEPWAPPERAACRAGEPGAKGEAAGSSESSVEEAG